MKKQNYKKTLVVTSIRIDPDLGNVMRESNINLSKLTRGLLEKYAEENGLDWK